MCSDGHLLAALLVDLAVADARHVAVVELVERDALLANGGHEPDRNGDHAERDRARPHWTRHASRVLLFGRRPCDWLPRQRLRLEQRLARRRPPLERPVGVGGLGERQAGADPHCATCRRRSTRTDHRRGVRARRASPGSRRSSGGSGTANRPDCSSSGATGSTGPGGVAERDHHSRAGVAGRCSAVNTAAPTPS